MKKIIANIEFKSLLTGLTIEQRNHKFNKELTKEGQRLEIAWDALQLVTKGVLKANNHGYWNYKIFNLLQGEDSKTTQLILNKNNILKENKCEVCQRGLMMISQIRLGNQLCMANDFNIENGDKNIIKGFTIDSFYRMEQEYEYSKYNHPYNNRTEEKLANICCNILVNGDFNLDDKTDYLTVIE